MSDAEPVPVPLDCRDHLRCRFQPKPREISVSIPPDKFFKNR
jgi:hypothetical protein